MRKALPQFNTGMFTIFEFIIDDGDGVLMRCRMAQEVLSKKSVFADLGNIVT